MNSDSSETPRNTGNFSKPSARRSLGLLACGAALGMLMAGYGLFTARGTRSAGFPPEAVALVNQRPVLRSDFMTQVQSQFAVPYSQTTREQRQRVLEDMIDEELQVQRGLEIDLPSYDPEVRSALVAGVELEVTADARAQEPTPAELRAYYEEHKDQYSSEGVFRLRDLVVRASAVSATAMHATAASAVTALRRGEPLESVMRRCGLTDSRRFLDSGHVDLGDIFQFSVRAKLPDPLFNAAVALKDGSVSDPIDDTDGVHILVVTSHHYPVPLGFDESSSRVWTDVKSAIQTKSSKANLKYLRSRADVVIAPELRR